MDYAPLEQAARLTNSELCRLLGVSRQLMHYHRRTGNVPDYIKAHIDTLMRLTPVERERVIKEKLRG